MASLPVTNPTSFVNSQEEESFNHENNDSGENQELTHQNQKKRIDLSLVLFQGFYFYSGMLPNIMAFQQHFQPQDNDIIVATKPKSGTTWLISLVYSIIHRSHFNNTNHPLLTKNPHEFAPNLEFDIYSLQSHKERQSDHLMMSSMTFPRLFSTHLPYGVLPKSIKDQSKSRIVYMARNPFDTVVSSWKFMTQILPRYSETTSFEEYVDKFCIGEQSFWPHWDHVLEYWKESRERLSKVLFLTYEDMHQDGISEMKKLAEFLGYGFSQEEERQEVIHEILRLCSIKNLKNLEVNKTGQVKGFFKNNAFFRKGEIGDWVNHLSPTMVDKMNQMVREKFGGSGLEFKGCT